MGTADSTRLKYVTALLAGLALGLSALLLYQSQTQDALPGCGGGSGCGDVLSSQWAYWLGIPVSLPALLLYAAMLCAVVMRDPTSDRPQRPAVFIMAVCAIAAMLSAAWFISVQLLIIKSLCKYCLATHAVGVSASVLCLAVASARLPMKTLTRSSLAGLLLVGVLVAGQILAEPPEAAAPLVQYAKDSTAQPAVDTPASTPTVTPSPIATPPPKPVERPATQPAKTGSDTDQPVKVAASKIVSLYGGRLKLDIASVPILGNPDAENILVCLFDYTCSHCRKTRGMLDRVRQKYGESLAIVCLPVPLNSKCNRLVKRRNYQHRFACDMAAISLAIWSISPEEWVRFDRQLYSNQNMLTPTRAKAEALKLVDEKSLKQAMKDPWIVQQVSKDVNLYAAASRATRKSVIPMLITKAGVMHGTPTPSDLDNFIKGQPIRPTQNQSLGSP